MPLAHASENNCVTRKTSAYHPELCKISHIATSVGIEYSQETTFLAFFLEHMFLMLNLLILVLFMI